MTSELRLGFGLLGAGLVAPFHARAIRASSKARLVGVADLDAARLGSFTREFDCRAYSSLDEMLADPAIQVVNVLTPNHLHTEAVVKAAGAGKHVLVEKPPATSLVDMDTMDAACLAAGVRAGVVFQLRALPAVRAIREAIRQGRFGKILHADAFMKWFRKTDYYRLDAWRSVRRSGGGVTLHHGIHYIDLLQHLAGPVRRLWASMSNITHTDIPVEDTLIAALNYENGARGVIEASTALWPGLDSRIEINGNNGAAVMVGEHIETWKFRDDQPGDDEIRSYGDVGVPTGATGLAGMSFREHQAVIEDMADAIMNDRQPMVTLANARKTLECALAMYVSAKRQNAVDLPLSKTQTPW